MSRKIQGKKRSPRESLEKEREGKCGKYEREKKKKLREGNPGSVGWWNERGNSG